VDIAVTITNTISSKMSLHDLPGPKCKNAIFAPEDDLENMHSQVSCGNTKALPR
jgi:hypothetical protein